MKKPTCIIIYKFGVDLDTHVTRREMKIENRPINSLQYLGAYQKEGGWNDPFSGKDSNAFWLTFNSLESVFKLAGFDKIGLCKKEMKQMVHGLPYLHRRIVHSALIIN